MVLENKMDALKDLNTGWCINAYRAKILQRQKRKKKKGSHIVRNSVMWLKCK